MKPENIPKIYAEKRVSTRPPSHDWKRKFGGMEVSEAKRLKQLEEENPKLKQMVTDLALDIKMFKDINSRKLG